MKRPRDKIALLLFFALVFFGWYNFFGGPNSQSYGLRRTRSWINQSEDQWQKLKADHPDLNHVSLFAYTGNNGCLGVRIAGKLLPDSERALREFTSKYNINRPVLILKHER